MVPSLSACGVLVLKMSTSEGAYVREKTKPCVFPLELSLSHTDIGPRGFSRHVPPLCCNS